MSFEEECYSRERVNYYLTIKADKVPGAGLDNVVTLNAEGNIMDSGINKNDLFYGSFADGGTF